MIVLIGITFSNVTSGTECLQVVCRCFPAFRPRDNMVNMQFYRCILCGRCPTGTALKAVPFQHLISQFIRNDPCAPLRGLCTRLSISLTIRTFSQPNIAAVSIIPMSTVQAFHLEKALVIVRFGNPHISKILLVILVDISRICCFHKNPPKYNSALSP